MFLSSFVSETPTLEGLGVVVVHRHTSNPVAIIIEAWLPSPKQKAPGSLAAHPDPVLVAGLALFISLFALDSRPSALRYPVKGEDS